MDGETINDRTLIAYTDAYIESVFEFWYSAGCPPLAELQRKVHTDEHDRRPHYIHIQKWAQEGQWQARADELNGRAIMRAEENLVTQQVEMWKEHAERAREVARIAGNYIVEHGFDSASSAVQALKWAQEEERKTRGAENFIALVKDKTNDDLIRMVRELATRQLSTEETVEAESTDITDTTDNTEESA